MRAFRIISVFLLFLLGGQFLFIPSRASAVDCCTNCQCKAWCTCPGTYPCAYCGAGDSDTFQANARTSNGTLSITVRDVSPAPEVTSPDVTGRVMNLLRGGKRVLGNLNLKIVNIQSSFKFACPGSDERNLENNKLALNLPVR